MNKLPLGDTLVCDELNLGKMLTLKSGHVEAPKEDKKPVKAKANATKVKLAVNFTKKT